MRSVPAFFVFAFVAGFAVDSSAQIDGKPKVFARLVAEQNEVSPGGSVSVAFEQDIRPGWHTYWLNAGDVGQSTEIVWTLPKSWHAGPIQWPYPRALPVGPFMDYGYEGKPWLLVELTAPRDAQRGDTVTLQAAASWLVCKEVCVPENATLTLPMDVSGEKVSGPHSETAHLPQPSNAVSRAFAAARARLPVPSPWPMRYRIGGDLELFVESPLLASARPAKTEYFPFANGEIQGAAKQRLEFARDGLALQLTPSREFKAGAPLSGVLVLTSADGSVQAVDVRAREGQVPEIPFVDGGKITPWLAFLFALLGGLILNLMPCVLPVLAMKAMALARHSGATTQEARNESLSYGSGAVLCFVGLGALLIGLRAGGAEIGWGFQLQEPVVVAAFALLMFAVGLNLSGVFEVQPIGAGDSLARTGGNTGAFLTGALAVAVAAPCTAPFMAVALGFALTQSPVIALGVFAMLGIGFAAPFVLLGFWSALRRALPRPGGWMLRLRQGLAFPMFGTAIWLVWVVALETNAVGVAAVLASLLLLAFALWLWGVTRSLKPRARGVANAAVLLGIVASLACLAPLRDAGGRSALAEAASSSLPQSEAYSSTRLASLRAAHRPVFVDATAAWCITCLVNEEAVLSRPAVRDAFQSHNVAFLVADWTRRNPAVTELLEANGRSGVPLYLYYAPGARQPNILGQVLTEEGVLSAVTADQK